MGYGFDAAGKNRAKLGLFGDKILKPEDRGSILLLAGLKK